MSDEVDPSVPAEGGGGGTASGEPIHPRPANPLPEAPEKKERGDLTRRLISSAVLVPLVTWVIVVGDYYFVALVLGFGMLGQLEFYRLIEDKGARPLTGIGLGFGAAVIGVAYLGTAYLALLLMTASLLFLMVAQLRKAQITESLASISGTFFGVFYVAWLISHAILLRFFYQSAESRFTQEELLELQLHPDSGIFLVFYAMAVLALCDTGAYFAGRAWGRRKLAREISPNKSVEGALGGIMVGTLSGLAFKGLFDVFWSDLSAVLPWKVVVPFGIVLAVVGIVGDLVESLLKRDAKVKDTGHLLPGMGGVLDRMDAPLLGLPVMYYLLFGYLLTKVG